MQTAAIRTVANSLPQNEVILLTLLISKWYVPYTELWKINGKTKVQRISPPSSSAPAPSSVCRGTDYRHRAKQGGITFEKCLAMTEPDAYGSAE